MYSSMAKVYLAANGTNSTTIPLLCLDVLQNSSLSNQARCDLVTVTESCFFNDGHIEYIYGMYCVFKDVVPLGITLMFLWLILMLIGLATTADAFFGPCLIVMADTLHLSQNVAGVTLLALGNGAPDIFSAISSITTLKDGDAGLAFGALLGAGMFVTSVTAGAIAIVKPFTAMTRPLMKDIVFYLFTIFWAFIIMFRQEITLLDSIGFIVLYVIYVTITVVSRALYSKGIGTGSKEPQEDEQQDAEQNGNGQTENPKESVPSIPMETIRRLRTDTDIRTNLTDIYIDNPAFSRDPAAAAAAGPASSVQAPRYDSLQRSSDADAGYDTSLDFPGGLRRVVDSGSEVDENGQEVKKPRSRRFQALDIRSSPKTSQSSQAGSRRSSARPDEQMKRVSRVQKISRVHSRQISPKTSTAGIVTAAGDEGFVSGGSRKPSAAPRKISTSSFTGVERRANYLTRWMLVYGNLENVEHRPRNVSQSSGTGGEGGRPRSPSNSSTKQPQPQQLQQQQRKVSDSNNRPSSSKQQQQQQQQKQQQISESTGSSRQMKISGGLGMDIYVDRDGAENRSRSASKTSLPDGVPGGQLSRSSSRRSESGQPGQDGEQGGRQGFKLSGGLGMDRASAYFQRREEIQARKQQQQKQKKLSLQRAEQDLSDDDEDIRQRHLYRIESVDEALDDAKLDHLNRLNQLRLAEERRLEKVREREEKERVAKEAAERVERENELDDSAEQPNEGAQEASDEEPSPFKEFLYSLVPIDLEEFPEMSWYNKVYEIIKAPILFLLLLTTPSVDYDQPLNGWSRILNSLHCALAPVFIGLAFKGYSWSIEMANGGSFPVLPIILLLGLLVGIIVFCTSDHFEPPRYHAAFAFFGFLTALVWIYTFANEVVNILESAGIIFNISSTILGLTVLAWANSIGDVISNTVLARQNFPRIAISACFGGPLFNLLLGVGIPFTIKLLGQAGEKKMGIQITLVQLVLVVSVTVSLIISMVYLTVFRFKLGKVYGIILVVLYVAFLVIALLAETDKLPPLP